MSFLIEHEAVSQPRLLFPLQPLPGESLPGLLARVTSWNHLRRTAVILEAAKIPATHAHDLSSLVAQRTEALAETLQIDTDQLAPLVIGAGSGPRLREFHGTQFRGSLIEHSRRRLSPAALHASPHHRALWMVRPLTYCPETWDILIDRCHLCRAALGWAVAFGIDACERCGADLAQAPTTQIPHYERESLAFVASLISPDEQLRRNAIERTPGEIHELPPGDAFELILAIARVLARADPKPSEPGAWEQALAAAGRVALAPEWNISALLKETPKANARTPDSVLKLRREAISLGRPNIIAAVNLLTLGWDGPRHGPTRLRETRLKRNELTLTEAAKQLGLSRSEMRVLVDKGLAVGDERAGLERKLVWLSPADVQSLKARLSGRVSAVTFSRARGLPLGAVEQLLDAGLLKRNHDPLVEALFGDLQLSRRSAERLVNALESHLGDRPPEPDWIPLQRLFTTIGGREKPWAFFIEEALRGRLPGGLRTTSPPRLDFRTVSASPEAAGMVDWWIAQPANAPRQPPCRRTKLRLLEVQGLLNCYPRDVSWLRSCGLLSRDPQRPAEIDRDLLAHFAGEHISTAEIAARTGRSGSEVVEMLKAAGIERAAGPFWPRAQVEPLLSMTLTPTSVRDERLEQHYRYVLQKTSAAVRTARVRAGLTQTDLGKLASISQNQISDVELRKAAPSLALLSRLSIALQRPLSDLIG